MSLGVCNRLFSSILLNCSDECISQGGLFLKGEVVYCQLFIITGMSSAGGRGSMIKSSAEAFAFLARQQLIEKHGKTMRLSYVDLTPYLSDKFGYIDPDFPHVLSSLAPLQPPPEDIQWIPAEELHENTTFSEQISSLQGGTLGRRSMGLALTLVNWFASDLFGDIFLQEVNPNGLYFFDVMWDGVFVRMPIDSYVPVNAATKEPVHSAPFKGSIFPPLYQKLLAKLHGSYEAITTQFLEIVELQTLFCKQSVPLSTGITLEDCQTLIAGKLLDKSIVSFRTRNSIRLESFGLESNHVYIILRLLDHDKEVLIEFLELEGESWLGKHSKLRSEWLLQEEAVNRLQIIRSEEYKENYMSLSDMKGMGRELIILNNTFDFHKNYTHCTSNNCLTMHKLTLACASKLMLRLNFNRRKCYNSIILLSHPESHLLTSSFHEQKDGNYLEAQLNQGEYYIVIYNSLPQEDPLPYTLTLFANATFPEITSQNNVKQILTALQVAFIRHLSPFATPGETVLCRQMYQQTGMSCIFVRSLKKPIQIRLDQKILDETRTYSLNIGKASTKVFDGKEGVIIFRCLWGRKENLNCSMAESEKQQKICFPPVGGVRVMRASQ